MQGGESTQPPTHHCKNYSESIMTGEESHRWMQSYFQTYKLTTSRSNSHPHVEEIEACPKRDANPWQPIIAAFMTSVWATDVVMRCLPPGKQSTLLDNVHTSVSNQSTCLSARPFIHPSVLTHHQHSSSPSSTPDSFLTSSGTPSGGESWTSKRKRCQLI